MDACFFAMKGGIFFELWIMRVFEIRLATKYDRLLVNIYSLSLFLSLEKTGKSSRFLMQFLISVPSFDEGEFFSDIL